jgi:diguanylate cyclase (GGDEF)-like protein
VRDPRAPGEALEIARRALEVCRRIDLDGAAEAFVRGAAEYSGLAIGLLYLYDTESDIDRLAAATLAPEDPWRREIAALDLGVLRVSNPGGGARLAAAPESLGMLRMDPLIAVPLPDGGRPTGILLLGDPRSAPGEGDLDPIGRLVEEMLPGLLNALRVEAYRDLVIKDDQSECFNRRHFDRSLSEEVYRAQRYATDLSLVFLDLDNLKAVNDRHGHAAGSRTVREVARRLVGGIRGSDRAYRYGGDEFCIILPATPPEGARELCERLRDSIASRPFTVESATQVRVTASFGIASYPVHARTSLGLIKCSDEAMQSAKRAGKNAVRIAGSEALDEPREAGGGAT